MGFGQGGGVLSERIRVLILAVAVGVILLTLFKLMFPEVEVTDVLIVIGLISLMIALGLRLAWGHLRRRGE